MNTCSLDLQITTLSGLLGNDICVYEIGTFCAMGGQHRRTFFCVKRENFHTHLAPSHSDHSLCNLEWASSAECSSLDICMRSASNYPYVLDMMICYLPTFRSGVVQSVVQWGRSQCSCYFICSLPAD